MPAEKVDKEDIDKEEEEEDEEQEETKEGDDLKGDPQEAKDKKKKKKKNKGNTAVAAVATSGSQAKSSATVPTEKEGADEDKEGNDGLSSQEQLLSILRRSRTCEESRRHVERPTLSGTPNLFHQLGLSIPRTRTADQLTRSRVQLTYVMNPMLYHLSSNGVLLTLTMMLKLRRFTSF